MGKGFARKKKQARALQEQFSKMQEEMADVEAVGTAGGGLVEVTLDSDQVMKRIRIKPDCVDPEDIEGLEDLICAAHKDAHEKLSALLPDPSSMMGGMGGMGAGMGGLGAMLGGLGG